MPRKMPFAIMPFDDRRADKGADDGRSYPVSLSAVRTPIGRFLGALSSLSATELGAIAIREAVKRARRRVERLDEVIMGNVVTAGEGQAPARQAALHGGIPDDVPAVTINKVCGSGLKAVMLASQAIKAGDGDLFVAGGMESMSNAPYLLPKARTGSAWATRRWSTRWCTTASGAPSRTSTWARRPRSSPRSIRISREAQDEFAYDSHMKATAATEAGRFRDEMIAVTIPQKKGALVVERDESIRADTSIETLGEAQSRLPQGVRHSDGWQRAGALMTARRRRWWRARHSPRVARSPALARMTGYAAAAIALRVYLRLPPARRAQAARAHRHEDERLRRDRGQRGFLRAGARQRARSWIGTGRGESQRRRGGAGASIGASGARVLATLVYELRRRGGAGLATLCLGGGGAVAMSVEV